MINKMLLTGLFTGVKPYDVDVNRNIDFLINDYSKIRTKAFQSSQMYKLDQLMVIQLQMSLLIFKEM